MLTLFGVPRVPCKFEEAESVFVTFFFGGKVNKHILPLLKPIRSCNHGHEDHTGKIMWIHLGVPKHQQVDPLKED